jgi:2-phosphosulfolactate phosphatase
VPELPDWSTQTPYGIRFDWGPAGAQALAPGSACLVVIDVLSFTTATTVAVEAGTRVFPYPRRDETAAAFAARKQASLAVARTAVTPESPWSLSPAGLQRAPLTDRLVLPSPNGSTIAAAASGLPVVAGCLRNATATARWLIRRGFGTRARPVGVIAAGERWPDGSLRPAVEDLLGAAAVISGLMDGGLDSLSPEAVAAGTCPRDSLAFMIKASASGRELEAGGFAEDVAIASQIDSTDVVPVLSDEAFEADPAKQKHGPVKGPSLF